MRPSGSTDGAPGVGDSGQDQVVLDRRNDD